MRTSYESTIDELKRKGIRLTPQRQWILRYLKDTTEHPTAEQVHQAVSKDLSGISVATVYNTLHTLTKLGVVHELSYGDGSSRFDGNDTEHAHLVCEDCGKVTDIPTPPVDHIGSGVADSLGFSIQHYRLEFYGQCASCSSKKR